MFGQQKRRVPKPEVVGPHRSANPMFTTPEQLATLRTRVGVYSICCLVLGIIAYLAYGPLFSIRDVTVQGARLVDPNSVKNVTEKYLNGQRWLILPNRTLWIFSSKDLSRQLEKLIRQRISVESVIVLKQRPHGITITVNERTPIANWTNGSLIGSVDGQGKIIELRSAVDANLPVMRDEDAMIFSVDSSVVKPEVMNSWKSLAGYFLQANIDVVEYLIPVPVCPAVATVENNTNTTSSNTNRSISNANMATQNTNIVSLNSNTTPPAPLPCDLQALRFSSQEIHAQLKDGPRVLFDRHSNLEQAIQALQRVLAERGDTIPQSIDVRFGDRVYVR